MIIIFYCNTLTLILYTVHCNTDAVIILTVIQGQSLFDTVIQGQLLFLTLIIFYNNKYIHRYVICHCFWLQYQPIFSPQVEINCFRIIQKTKQKGLRHNFFKGFWTSSDNYCNLWPLQGSDLTLLICKREVCVFFVSCVLHHVRDYGSLVCWATEMFHQQR